LYKFVISHKFFGLSRAFANKTMVAARCLRNVHARKFHRVELDSSVPVGSAFAKHENENAESMA
jgi:hypothetical protein